MNTMSKFQIAVTGIFGICILIGVFVFAFVRPNSTTQSTVLVWGPLSETEFSSVITNLPIAKDKTVTINYVSKREADFDREFVEALASGVGPDVVFLSQDSLLTHKQKLYPVPYESYPERTFKDRYIEGGELFLDPSGVLAFPVLVDPLVMYWNRSLFTANGIVKPPEYWDQMYTLSKVFTQKDGALNLSRSTIALGEFQNITNSKEIIATLIMQAGGNPVSWVGGTYESTFAQNFGQPVAPAISAVNFYTEFSNPLKPYYSWNRSLPESQLMFTSGDLALYLGFASEYPTIKAKNPNLNFDVTDIPQARDSGNKVTFGKMKALAITKNSKNPAAAFTVINGLSTFDALSAFAGVTGLPPVLRERLSRGTNDPNQAVFYRNAVWSKAWLDPSRSATRDIFRIMIESVTGGRARSSEAVDQADRSLGALFRTN